MMLLMLLLVHVLLIAVRKQTLNKQIPCNVIAYDTAFLKIPKDGINEQCNDVVETGALKLIAYMLQHLLVFHAYNCSHEIQLNILRHVTGNCNKRMFSKRVGKLAQTKRGDKKGGVMSKAATAATAAAVDSR